MQNEISVLQIARVKADILGAFLPERLKLCRPGFTSYRFGGQTIETLCSALESLSVPIYSKSIHRVGYEKDYYLERFPTHESSTKWPSCREDFRRMFPKFNGRSYLEQKRIYLAPNPGVIDIPSIEETLDFLLDWAIRAQIKGEKPFDFICELIHFCFVSIELRTLNFATGKENNFLRTIVGISKSMGVYLFPCSDSTKQVYLSTLMELPENASQ